jgi:hypothetical protein
VSALRPKQKIVEPAGSPHEAELMEASIAAAERILADRGFFELLAEGALDVVDVKIPFELAKVGAGYTVAFAARRIGMHIADAVVAGLAAQQGMDRGKFEQYLKLPFYTRLRAGKDADATERFHRLAKLLAEQLFYGQQDIFKLMAGLEEYTDWKANAGMKALAILGSAAAVPVELVETKGGKVTAMSGRAGAGVAEGAGALGGSLAVLGLMGLIASPMAVPGGIALLGLGALYAAASETARTRALHEIAHVIQFEMLGSALNDGLITPQDFWHIVHEVKSGYAFGGGTEQTADFVAYNKVMGDMFDWYRIKSTAYFAKRAAEGDATAMERLAALRKRLDDVRELLEQEGFAEELKTIDTVKKQGPIVKKLVKDFEKGKKTLGDGDP